MQIDIDFWNDLDIKNDLESECSGVSVRIPLYERNNKKC